MLNLSKSSRLYSRLALAQVLLIHTVNSNRLKRKIILKDPINSYYPALVLEKRDVPLKKLLAHRLHFPSESPIPPSVARFSSNIIGVSRSSINYKQRLMRPKLSISRFAPGGEKNRKATA